MKKINIFLFFCLMIFSFALANIKVNAVSELGTVGNGTTFYSLYQSARHGIVRSGDLSQEVTIQGGWGCRGGFSEKYDITSLEYELNLSALPKNSGAIITISNNAQSYAGESSTGIIMDLIKSNVVDNKYLVTLSTDYSTHNKSIDGFTNSDTESWDNTTYTGVVVYSETGNISVKFVNDTENNIQKVYINDVEYTVSGIFNNLTSPSSSYVSIGVFNTSEIVTYNINYMLDAEKRTYYENVYKPLKENLDLYSDVLNKEEVNTEDLALASQYKNSINMDLLNEYDLAYLTDTKTALDTKLSGLYEELNVQDLNPILETLLFEQRLDKLSSIEVGIELYELAIDEITIDETPIDAQYYSVTNGKLIIISDVFSDLSIGDHTIVIVTSRGSCQLILKIIDPAIYLPEIIGEYSYQQGLEQSLIINVDLKEQLLTSVKIDEESILTFDLVDSELKISGDILESLTPGNHILSIQTSEGIVSITLEILENDGTVSRVPELNIYDEDAFFYSRWQPANHGAIRTGDLSMDLIGLGNWGQRGGLAYTYDLSNFEISLNLEKLQLNGVVSLMFSSDSQTYIGEAKTALIMDIVKDKTDGTKFMITCSNTSHNVSLDGFNNNQKWNDVAYSGVVITAEDYNVTLKIVKTETGADVTVNGTTYSVGGLYEKFDNISATYCGVGTFNVGDNVYYTINYAYDTYYQQYYSAEGTFGLVKTKLNELKEATEILETIDQISAAIEISDSISFEGLTTYDKAYLEKIYNKYQELINAALANNENYVLSLIEEEVQKYVNLVNSFNSLDLMATIETQKALLDTYNETLSNSTSELAAEMLSLINQTYNIYINDVQTFVNNQIDAYKSKVNTAVSIDDIIEAFLTRDLIRIDLATYFESFEVQTEKIKNISSELQNKFKTINNNYTVNDNAYVVNGENLFEALLIGNTCISSNVLFNVLDFSMKLNVKELGSEFSVALLEKPETYVDIESDEIQNNKGIVLKFTKLSENIYQVELIIINLLSYGLSSSTLVDSFAAEFNEEVEIIISDNNGYLNVEVDVYSLQTRLSTDEIRIALGLNTAGYLVLSSKGTSDDCVLVVVNSICGKQPLSEELTNIVEVDEEPKQEEDQSPEKPSEEKETSCSKGSLVLLLTSLITSLSLVFVLRKKQ